MAKFFTCKVTLSDESEQYFALESYVMQCLINMSGCDQPVINGDSDKHGVFCTDNADTYSFIYSATDYTNEEKNKVAVLVTTYLDELVLNPEDNVLVSVTLGAPPTRQLQTCTSLAPVIKLVSGHTSSYAYPTLDDLQAYNDGTLPSNDAGTAGVLSVLHAHIRYRLAIMDDDKFKTLVEAWKTCIVKTLSGLSVTFSNEAVQ